MPPRRGRGGFNTQPPTNIRTTGAGNEQEINNLQEELRRINTNRVQRNAIQDRPWIRLLAAHVPFANGTSDGTVDNNLSLIGPHIQHHYNINRDQNSIVGVINNGNQRLRGGGVHTHSAAFTPFDDVITGIVGRPRSTSDSLTLQHQNIPVIQVTPNEVMYAPVNSSTIYGKSGNRNDYFDTINTMFPDFDDPPVIDRATGEKDPRYGRRQLPQTWDTTNKHARNYANTQTIAQGILGILNGRDRNL